MPLTTNDNIIPFQMKKNLPLKQRRRPKSIKQTQAIYKEVAKLVFQAEMWMRQLLHKYVKPQSPMTDNTYFLKMVSDYLSDLKSQTTVTQQGNSSKPGRSVGQLNLSDLGHRINCIESLIRIGLVETLMEEMENEMAYSVITLHECVVKVQKLIEKF